jgi:hypothetical protein
VLHFLAVLKTDNPEKYSEFLCNPVSSLLYVHLAVHDSTVDTYHNVISIKYIFVIFFTCINDKKKNRMSGGGIL